MTDDDLRARLQRLEDREAIRELHNQYCFLQDCGHQYRREEDVDLRTRQGWKFLLHREVPFFFVKEKEGWAGPKPQIMREWLANRPK